MSAAGHTPGPWKRFGVYNHIEIRTEAGELIAVVGSEQLRAARFENARLIAAAPDLLKAAEMVLEWYEAEEDHSKADFYQRMQMCRDSESAVRAAIAKATGAAQQPDSTR